MENRRLEIYQRMHEVEEVPVLDPFANMRFPYMNEQLGKFWNGDVMYGFQSSTEHRLTMTFHRAKHSREEFSLILTKKL